MTSKTQPVLTEGSPGRHLARLAMPMIVGILAMMGFNMVDTFFVGQLGTIPLAAMAVTFPIVMAVMSLALGLSVSTSIAVSRAIGAGDREKVRRLTTDALTLGVLLAGVCTVVGFFALEPTVRLLEGDMPTHDPATAYLRVWLSGLLFVVVPMVANMAVRATGDTVTPSVLIILGVVLNAVLDPILIFGWGPVPGMGIAGAAWATVLSRAGTLVAALWVVGFRDRMLTSPVAKITVILASWRRLLGNGIPIALNNLITPVMTGALTRLVATAGASTAAAFGVACRVEGFVLTTVFALQSVIGIFIGQNAGANRWDRVRQGVVRSEVFSFAWGGAVCLLLVLVGRSVIRWFNPDPEVVAAAYLYFVIVGATLGFRGIYLVDSAGLNALDHAVAATVLTVIQGLVLAIPLAWIGFRIWGVAGVFLGIAIANVVIGIATALWLARLVRKARAAAAGG